MVTRECLPAAEPIRRKHQGSGSPCFALPLAAFAGALALAACAKISPEPLPPPPPPPPPEWAIEVDAKTDTAPPPRPEPVLRPPTASMDGSDIPRDGRPERDGPLPQIAGALLASGLAQQERRTERDRPASPAPASVSVSSGIGLDPARAPILGSPAQIESFCEITSAFERASDCERFAAQLAAVREGRHGFRPQQPMVRGEPAMVRYAIVRLPASVQQGRGTAAERNAAIAATNDLVRGEIARDGERGAVRTEAIQVGRLMYACLAGDSAFVIEPASCSSIDTLENPTPVWRWQVTPQREGEDFKLTLTSGIEVRTATGEVRRIGQFSRSENIDVTVSAAGKRDDLFSEAEGWVRSPLGLIGALTALIGALTALVLALRKLRRREPGAPAAPSQPSKPTIVPAQTSAPPAAAAST